MSNNTQTLKRGRGRPPKYPIRDLAVDDCLEFQEDEEPNIFRRVRDAVRLAHRKTGLRFTTYTKEIAPGQRILNVQRIA